jgi:hypothetical protein
MCAHSIEWIGDVRALAAFTNPSGATMHHTNIPKSSIQKKPKAQAKAITKPKTRARKPKAFNAKNLALHMKELLEEQYIQNVIRFFTPELLALAESADPELKKMIRNAAEESDEIAEICTLVDAVCVLSDGTAARAD